MRRRANPDGSGISPTRWLHFLPIGFGIGVAVATQLAQAAIELPQGPNRDLVYGKCRTCHDLQYLKDSMGITRAQWDGVLADMENFGLEINDQQRKQILNYLGTYLGPNPPTAGTEAKGPKAATGKSIFAAQCVSCHQSDGQGVTGEFPPLAGNSDLFLSHTYPALVLLNGLQGKIEVEGKSYNGQMPSFDFLSNGEIAALVGYIRNAWGNANLRPGEMEKLTAKDVAEARQKKLGPNQVHEYRARYK